MKKALSFVLAFVLLTGMIPFASASGFNTFDPIAELEQETVWNYIEINGSLLIDTDTFFDLEDGEEHHIYDQDKYYYDPNTNVTTMILESRTPDSYKLQYYDNYPTAVLFTYYEADGEDQTTAEEANEAYIMENWDKNVSGYDLSNAVLKYAEEEGNYYIYEYDLGDRDVTFYFSNDTHWLRMTRERGFMDYGEPYDVIKEFSICESEQPDTSIKNSLSYEALGKPAELPDENPQSGSDDAWAGSSGGSVPFPDRLTFSSTDIYGWPVDESIIEGSQLVIVNFWEPSCGMCTLEMPDMETLYQKYKNAGVLFLGVYGRDEDSTDEEARYMAEDTGVTYPVFRDCPSLAAYENNGWPENYFFDGQGRLLTQEPIGGYKTKEAWEALILKYLYS